MSLDFTQRLRDLSDHVEKDNVLLKEYEDALRLEGDPRRKTKYRQEIENIKASVKRYWQEYEELAAQATVEERATVDMLSKQLRQIDSKVNLVLDGQVVLYHELGSVRQKLLEHYNLPEQAMIGDLTLQLNKTQLSLAQILVTAFELDQPSDLETQKILALIEHKIAALPVPQRKALEIIKDPALDAKHKLKVSIPVIPFILDYEGELELGTGFNLQTAWEWVKIKLLGRG